MLDLRRKSLLVKWAVFASLLTLVGLGIPKGSAAPNSHAKKAGKSTPEPTVEASPSGTVPEAAGTPPAQKDVPPAATVAPDMPPLTAEQMADSVQLEVISVPTPGELFAALNKQCKPDWTGEFRGPITTAYSDRSQAALNLGGLIADGYVAVEAMDSQQVKNLGRDILGLSKNLGISKGILDRGESINRFAEDNDWPALKEELESMQNDVKQEMETMHDDDLITLLSVGAWIRGTYVVSDVVLKHFSQNTSCILRQPALVNYLHERMDKLPPRMKDSASVKTVSAGVDSLSKLLSFPLGDTPSKEDVQKMHDEAGELLQSIAKK